MEREVAHEAKDATCTEIGWNEYVTCSRCNFTTYEELVALGHNIQVEKWPKGQLGNDRMHEEQEYCTNCEYTSEIVSDVYHKYCRDEKGQFTQGDGNNIVCDECGWECQHNEGLDENNKCFTCGMNMECDHVYVTNTYEPTCTGWRLYRKKMWKMW